MYQMGEPGEVSVWPPVEVKQWPIANALKGSDHTGPAWVRS